LAYVTYYPLETEYSPLWPNYKEKDQKTGGDEAMKEKIRHAMEQGGNALEELKHQLTVYEEVLHVGDDSKAEADEEEESFFTKS
jgi:hypothetical protein